ncbi:hypothetical protein CCYA_CCYA15G3895 [Cyanidiococcus yangmingshanensis]|nr:hypothetical protein CCYA_CCYA15G3895 [Cyanidiococcus yangmingshanensis]
MDLAREQVSWNRRFASRLFARELGSRAESGCSPSSAWLDAPKPNWRTPLLAALEQQRQNENLESGKAPLSLVRAEKQWPVPLFPETTASRWAVYRKVVLDGGQVVALGVSADNQTFAAGVWDRTIRLLDLATGQTVHVFRSDSQLLGPARTLLFPESTPHLLFSGAADKRVLGWDVRTGRVALRLVGHRASVDALAAHPRLSFVVTSGGADETIRVWDTRASGNMCVHELTGHQNRVRALVCRATEPQLLSASEDCTVRVWDLAQGTAQSVCTRHTDAVVGLSIRWIEAASAADELEQLVSLSADGVRIWNMPGMELVEEIDGTSSTLSAVAVSEDGQIVTSDLDGNIHLWDAVRHNWHTRVVASFDADARTPSSMAPIPPIVLSAVFDRSATRLLTGCSDHSIRMWRAKD